MNREPIDITNDDAQYEDLKAHQSKCMKDRDTHKDPLSFPIGSMVVIQLKDGGPWMHRVTKEAYNSDHNGRSYIVRVTKNGQIDNAE